MEDLERHLNHMHHSSYQKVNQVGDSSKGTASPEGGRHRLQLDSLALGLDGLADEDLGDDY